MAKYLVTLNPTGRFFFGGDMTFTVGDKEEDKNVDRRVHNEKFSSYIIHSSKFPQQTSILGMLRFLLLANDETVFDKENQKIKKEAIVQVEGLIGKKSFGVNLHSHQENVFGNIQKIGACFLYDAKSGKRYFPAPVDFSLFISGYETVVETATLNGKLLKIPSVLKDGKLYSSKTELSEEYIAVEGGKVEILKSDNIFKEDERIGIRKNANGKTEDDAFYKQIGYKMKQPNFAFAFMLEMEKINLKDCNEKLVTLGADSSTFVFNASLLEENEKFQVDLPGSDYISSFSDEWVRVVLLSDTYLEEKDLEHVQYAICSTKPFRFLSFTVATENYNVMKNVNGRSTRYNLYKAGSVFFLNPSQIKEFKDKIDAKKEFCQIGYNQYYQ